MSSDTDKSRAFYGELFGWTSEEAGPEYGGYINFLKDGEPVAGCMSSEGQEGPANVWSVYLATDDAKATADAAASHGGEVFFQPMDVGELGTMAFVSDPGGAAIGIWQPGLHKGFGIVDEPGTPGWFELHTRDYDKVVEFYRDVFRWKTHVMSDATDFRYTTLGEGENQKAGIMDATDALPDGVPAHWSIYFRVDDTDKALAKVVDLGGAIVVPAEDTPYGRLAHASDTTGSLFKLVAG
jgi:predicted enzyme related to lactoylglutathione lyase